MSTVKTYLVIVYTLTGDMIRATEYFGEQDTRRTLDEAGIHWPADRKEIHLMYDIVAPLTEEQVNALTYLKNMGICDGWSIRDEITPDAVDELSEKTGIDVQDKQQVKEFWVKDETERDEPIKREKPTYEQMVKKLKGMVDDLKGTEP